MKENVLAVIDSEETYTRRLTQMMEGRDSLPFRIHAFTDVDKLVEYASTHTIDVLLADNRLVNKEIRDLSTGQIILLSDGKLPVGMEDYPAVYKYQSSEKIVQEVMRYYAQADGTPMPAPILKKTVELIGVYSPVGRCLKTTFSLTLGQILAEEYHTLYLNLEEYSGFETRLGKIFDVDLSDVIYYLRQEKPNLIYFITGLVQKIGQLDFIPPAYAPMDLREVTWREWEQLLDELMLHSAYERIVVDFGYGLDELFRILNLCSKIYMPIREDDCSNAKLQQFDKLIGLTGQETLRTKIRRLTFPTFLNLRSGCWKADQLAESEIGEHVRLLLKEDSTWTQ